MSSFVWSVRVYYEDTDAGGVVYYANYLKFMERARTEWLRALGIEQDVLRRETGALLMVHSLTVDYLQPARFNELLAVSVRLEQLGKARLTMMQTVARDEQVLCRSRVTIACVDEQIGRARRFPDQLEAILTGLKGVDV
jgi:acyl-CoA thioester hydrolase